jgi:alpha-soluble NSF attachment protein
MSANACPKGDGYKADAAKAMARVTLFGFGKNQKYEDAADLYTKAANAYKLANLWQSAGEMYIKASECYKFLQSNSDHVNSMVEAANCFKKISPLDSVAVFKTIIELCNDNGKFSNSAKYHKEVAEIFESVNDFDQAIFHYQQSANLYKNDNKKQSANPCLLKIATMASSKGDYLGAAKIYEDMGNESTESRLGAYSAKNHFFACLLCHMASGDLVATRNKAEEFKQIDHTFSTCRESEFIEKLVAVSSSDHHLTQTSGIIRNDIILFMNRHLRLIMLKHFHKLVQILITYHH